MDDRRSPVSRRAAMAGIGAAVGTAVFAERVAAGASPGTNVVPFAKPITNSSGPAGNELIGRPTIRLAAADFRAASSTDPVTLAPGGLTCTGAATLTAAFHPRGGDTISSVTIYLNPGGTARLVRVSAEGNTGVVSNLVSGTSPGGSAATSVRLDIPNFGIRADPLGGSAYTVTIDAGAGTVVYGAEVTVFSSASEFVLVDPFRVWDSRTPSGTLLIPSATAGGRISSGQTRGFTVDGFITRGAAGLMLNVTLADTVGAGFLTFYAENPDDPTPPPISSINWYAANQIVANLVVTGMAGEADVTIHCGGGGNTHYIIDCLGYFI